MRNDPRPPDEVCRFLKCFERGWTRFADEIHGRTEQEVRGLLLTLALAAGLLLDDDGKPQVEESQQALRELAEHQHFLRQVVEWAFLAVVKVMEEERNPVR